MILAAILLFALTPEECLVVKGDAAAVVVRHEAKTYRLTSEACAEEFRSDPERFSQLYDALLELHAERGAIAKPKESLVPS